MDQTDTLSKDGADAARGGQKEEMRMKTRIMGKIGVCLLILALVPLSALAQRWTFSIGGAYIGGFKINDARYYRTVTPQYNEYVLFTDDGSVSAKTKANAGAMFSLMYSFSKSFGLQVQAGYMPATPVDMRMRYSLTWTFSTTDNSGTYAITQEGTDSGDISAIPLNLNVVLTLPLGKSTFFNISPGIGFLFSKLRLYSPMGYGVSNSAVVTDVKWSFTGSSGYSRTTKTASWVDYYSLKLKSEKQSTSVGFNIGLDLEQKISRTLGIYLGGYYCTIGKTDWTWNLVPQSVYAGVFGNLDSNTTGAVVIPQTTSSVNLSHFSAHLGLKLHF